MKVIPERREPVAGPPAALPPRARPRLDELLRVLIAERAGAVGAREVEVVALVVGGGEGMVARWRGRERGGRELELGGAVDRAAEGGRAAAAVLALRRAVARSDGGRVLMVEAPLDGEGRGAVQPGRAAGRAECAGVPGSGRRRRLGRCWAVKVEREDEVLVVVVEAVRRRLAVARRVVVGFEGEVGQGARGWRGHARRVRRRGGDARRG